jgi:6,7-dimethyl-8-ribityllumazine synthase
MMQSPTSPSLAGRRIAVVAARWHADLVDRAVVAFDEAVTAAGALVDVVVVPGAFEIPLRAKRLALSGGYDAIACCALVVDGGIYRHDFVASTVVDALMRVQLDTDVPVFSAVLTPHHFHEHEEHRSFFERHLAVKGVELADAVGRTLAEPVTVPTIVRG